MQQYPIMRSREGLRLLARDGWIVRRQSGSHVILSRPDGNSRVIVPDHPSDLPPGTLRSIFSQAGLSPTDVDRLRGLEHPMDRYTYTIVLTPEAGAYVVSVPTLPGCVTVGTTVEEALAMAADAIALWIEDLADAGEPIPVETEPPRTAIVTVGLRSPALR